MPGPINQHYVDRVASELVLEINKAISNTSLVHLPEGESNVDAAILVATTNVLARQLLLRGVDEQHAVNALVTTMRLLKKASKK